MASQPRCFLAAMPTPEEAEMWLSRLQAAGVTPKLARRMFAIENWHQTLSDRHFDADAGTRQRLMQAGAAIAARGFTLRFNRVAWSQRIEDERIRIHCTLLAQGRPPRFDALLQAVQRALDGVGLADGENRSPHVTLSYEAEVLHPDIAILPIQWAVREVLLVEGHGTPYRYDVLARWPLQPPADASGQGDFFASPRA